MSRARRWSMASLWVVSACGGEVGPARPAEGPLWFEEVAQASGIDFVHEPGVQRYWFPEIVGAGLAFLDYDGDGDLDLYAVQSGDLQPEGPQRPANRLFQNAGDGTFGDVTQQAGVGDTGYGMGCVVGDYDGDGDADLYVTNLGPNVLYRNDGDGTFSDVTALAGVGHPGWGMSGVFFDADGDGDLDLFFANYVGWSLESELECLGRAGGRDYCEPINYNAPGPDVLYLNRGDGTFEDATQALGLGAAFGNGMGVACGDFDGDGRSDLYVANDGTPNQLWLNRGGRFEESSLLAGCAVNGDGHAEASMGVVAVDVEEDGDLDLFATHLRGEKNTLWVNEAGFFVDRTSRTGMALTSLPFTGFGTAFGDFDLDGLLDLYVVNGRVGYWRPAFSDEEPYAEPDLCFRGLGRGRFEEVLPRAGTAQPWLGNSRGLALGDYDDDGDLDLAVLDNGGQLRLLRNVAPRRGGWAVLDVRESEGGAALGARLEIEVGGLSRRRVVSAAFSYLSSNDPRVHVGLGRAQGIDEVTIQWPDGSRESFGPLAGGTLHVLRRGAGLAGSGRGGTGAKGE